MLLATLLYYFVISIMIFSGYQIIAIGKSRLTLYSKPKELVNKLAFNIKDRRNILSNTGFTLSKNIYNIARLMGLIASLIVGYYFKNQFLIISSISLYIISIPIENIQNKTTIYGKLITLLRKSHSDKKDMEIYQSIALLRNMIKSNKFSKLSSDYMIEQLAVYSELLRNTYFKVLNLLRLNRKQEAIQLFSSEVRTKVSSDFGRLIIELENMENRELDEILISLQKNIREERITKLKKNDEIISDILYIPVVLNVLLIFINFLYIAYFINQKNVFSMLIN
jgi:hypothetical protein